VLRRRDGSVRFPAKIAAGTRPVPKEKTTSIGKRTRAVRIHNIKYSDNEIIIYTNYKYTFYPL
jgi:hypothetical protein